MTAIPPMFPICMSMTTASTSAARSAARDGSLSSSISQSPMESEERTSLTTHGVSATTRTFGIGSRLAPPRVLTSVAVRYLASAIFALALAACSSGQGGGIDVIDVSGPLDASAMQFMIDSIEDAAEIGQEMAVLQINSRAVLDAEVFSRLEDLVVDPPLPVAVWVGPAPASAFGGAGIIAWSAQESAIAPGSLVAPWEPLVLGEGSPVMGDPLEAAESGLELQPTIRQYLQDLDGRTLHTSAGPVTVSTLEEFGDGITLKTVTFRKPGPATRLFRLAVTPEAAFFFLVVGLTVVAFEFYALGPAVAAAVGGVALLLAGWGVVVLPVRWWAVALAIGSWVLITSAHQKGGAMVLSLLAAAGMQVAGMQYVDGAGQLDPSWILVLASVLAVLFFYLIAMPTVQKARLSTPTIGREGLIGLEGSAISAFDPDGMVDVSGARWRATAHREAGLSPDDRIVVTGVDGMFLEVERVGEERENFES